MHIDIVHVYMHRVYDTSYTCMTNTRQERQPMLESVSEQPGIGRQATGPLAEQYRPRNWSDVVGQDKVVNRIQGLVKRGLGGRAFWLSGQSGTGKTTIARLIAAEVADELCIHEVDAAALTVGQLRDLEREM